jgi:acyl carrier protein
VVEVTDTAARVRRVVQMHTGVMPEKTTGDALLREDLGADSLGCVEIVMMLEDEFHLAISDDDAAQVLSVGDAIQLVERLRAELVA